nr:moricin [Lymantria dispar]
MKCSKLIFVMTVIIALLIPTNDAAPGKIPVKAIKKAGEVVGKGLRAINIASTVHDVVSFFKPKHKPKHKKKH